MSLKRYGASEGLRFLEPRFSPFAHTLVRLLSPAFLRIVEGIRSVEVNGARTLLEEYRRFGSGESRLFVAFRHPSASDAPVVGHLFARRIQRLARLEGVTLPRRSFVHFLYGRGVPLWSGAGTGWLLPRVGAIPVYHRRVDSRGMGAVRKAAVEGPFPIALAPEGQVTYHNKRFGELEGGTGRIALWCKADLQRLGEDKEVRILPLAIEYRFGPKAAEFFDRALAWVETKTGLSAGVRAGMTAGQIYDGLIALTEALLHRLERLYAPFRREAGNPGIGDTAHAGSTADAPPIPGARADSSPTSLPTDLRARLREQIEAVCDTVLGVGEASHGLPGNGSLLDRVFRLRDAGWKRMFRDDLAELSPLERAHADALAEQAKLSARQMELVDALEYLDPRYISRESDFDRFLEYALMLQDVVNRLLGGTIAGRMRAPRREAMVTVGTPASVEELLRRAQAPEEGPRQGMGSAGAAIADYIASEFARLMGSSAE